MRDAGSQQADGRKFVGLGELDFEFDALGDIVHDDEAADDVELARHQRRDGHVDDTGFAGRRCQPELVEIVDAGILPHAVELLDEGRRKNLAQRASDHLPAWLGIHHFHLGVPRLDAILQIDGQHADVNGLDDVFVEILEALVLAHLLFERCVQARVLDRDGNVARESLQQLDVFAREEIAFHGLAKAEKGDGLLPGVAWDVIIQIKA